MPLPAPRLALAPLLVVLALAPACDPNPPLDEADEAETGEHETGESETGEPSVSVELIDAEAWLATPAELDALAAHRPSEVICPTAAYALEFGLLEVDTGQCNYLSVSQPLAHAIAPGDRLRVTVWWQTLVAGEPAQGHLALLGDAGVLWQTHVDIPGEAALRQIEFESPIAIAAGEPITFHLHNHGYNSWTLGGLELLGHAE